MILSSFLGSLSYSLHPSKEPLSPGQGREGPITYGDIIRGEDNMRGTSLLP